VTALVIVHCDGTPADRPGMALSRCRAFLPLRGTTHMHSDAVAAGWTPATDGGPTRDLCPGCTRAAATS
jgi:hypothetical protein